ncbi:hypothetical protein Tco_0015869, partial [Tanacetum coccineum]
MEKNKEDDAGACFEKLETLEEDVSKMKKMMMEKNKDDDVRACFEKLKILEEDVSKLTRMMMEKNKEDDMGACIEKLDKMGWGREEPIYDTALLLFGQSADYRKLWLHLKMESCGKWVKNAGKYVLSRSYAINFNFTSRLLLYGCELISIYYNIVLAVIVVLSGITLSSLITRKNGGETLKQTLNNEAHAWKNNCVDFMGKFLVLALNAFSWEQEIGIDMGQIDVVV